MGHEALDRDDRGGGGEPLAHGTGLEQLVSERFPNEVGAGYHNVDRA